MGEKRAFRRQPAKSRQVALLEDVTRQQPLIASGAQFHILFDRDGPDTLLEFGQRRSRSSERGS